MNQVAFTIFNVDIYWYAIIITLSFVIALLLCKIDSPKFGIVYEQILDLSLILIPVSIICARLYYVLFNLDYYSNNLLDIFNLRNGGLAIYGGIIGGTIVIYVFCKIRKINFLDLTDYIVPYVALGQSIGRWGNYFNGESYGTATNLPWKMQVIEEGVVKYVHPTFLYESIITFVIFLILIKMSKKRKFSGIITYTYIISYSFARIFIEGLRIDSLMLYNIKISQILSIILFVVFCIILAKKLVKSK